MIPSPMLQMYFRRRMLPATRPDRGRNQLHIYERDDQTEGHYTGEIQWASRVKKALKNDEFQLNIQPIVPVNVSARNKKYMEILVRMRDENGRPIPRGAFLPTVERYNLMGQLDSWVLKHTLAELSKESVNLDEIGRVFINLSRDSLMDSQFVETLVTIMRKSRVSPTKLCFEVTESSAMSNLTKANATINSVRELGCRFALDDFGTGVSSFAYLKALNVDYLKIDGTHIRELADDKGDYEIVRAITQIGHALGREVIAESVESKRVLTALQEIGVDFVQGYTLAPPRPIEHMYMTVAPEMDQ